METLHRLDNAVEVRLTATEVLALRTVMEQAEWMPLEVVGPQQFLTALRDDLRALHRSLGADW